MCCKCFHSFRKNDPPHNVFLTLCIVSDEVKDYKCSCVAGFVSYCNHSLALILKACKFSLCGSQNTKNLENEGDQIPLQACASKLQTWHKKVAVKLSILSLLWMSLFQNPNWRIQSVERKEFILSFTRGKK